MLNILETYTMMNIQSFKYSHSVFQLRVEVAVVLHCRYLLEAEV